MSTLEAVAHYQRAGDGPARLWAVSRLLQAVERGEVLPYWNVLGEWQAGWVQVVIFTFRFSTTEPLPYAFASGLALALAESIVGEADVQVLGLSLVGPAVNAADSFRTKAVDS